MPTRRAYVCRKACASTSAGLGRVSRPISFRAGSSIAVREPRRSALSLLHESLPGNVLRLGALARSLGFNDREIPVLFSMLERGFRAPVTTSAGRTESLRRMTEQAGGKQRYWFTTLDQISPSTVLKTPIWQVATQSVLQPLVMLEEE